MRPNSGGPALLEVRGPIATITLNRPSKLNAIDESMIERLLGYLDFAEFESGIRAVILTGAGTRAFSAGADIAELRKTVHAGTGAAVRDFVRRGQGLTRRIENFRKPVIAAVNGLAYGGGCEIVEACQLAVAAEGAAFAKPEIKLGFAPPFGGSQRLPRLIGRKRALQMILTGEQIPAQAAQQIGLINEICTAETLLDSARSLARKVIRHTPDAVRACLHSVTRGINLSIDEGLAVEASEFERMAGTDDVVAGIQQFLGKRGGADASATEQFLAPIADVGKG
ncbi:MAG TPA: enoyl-CoA hydratase-related protein [Xanthobacteraceae bacterium]|nr:enoyl-CoA hydratase-related protein [Xanthobacteraceae bacterium]